jgi:hypothetical protein
MRLFITQEYDLEVWAASRSEAEIICEDIDPTEYKCEHVDTSRDSSIQEELSLEEIFNEATAFDWEETPTGGNCWRLQAEISPNLYAFIVEPESAQLPTSPTDKVELTLAHRVTGETEMLFYGDLEDLPALISIRLERARMRNTICAQCGRLLIDCEQESQETREYIRNIQQVIKDNANNYDLVTSLTYVLDGYLTHAVPQCNTESRA